MGSFEDLYGLEHSSLELPKLDFYSETYRKNSTKITIFPTLHNEAYFSKLATKLVSEHSFDLILLELPNELEIKLKDAIYRLPLPTVLYHTDMNTNKDRIQYDPSRGYIVHPGESLFWLAHLGNDRNIDIEFIDHWHVDAYRSWNIPLNYPYLASIGWKKIWEYSGKDILSRHLNQELHVTRSYSMGSKLIQFASDHDHILLACGAAHWPIIAHQLEREGFTNIGQELLTQEIKKLVEDTRTQFEFNNDLGSWELADIHPQSLYLITSDLPYYIGRMVENPSSFDYLESLRQLYFAAEQVYFEKFDTKVSPSRYRRLFQYLRNLNRLDQLILPNLYNIVTAAKGTVDDDFAFEVFRIAISYPFLPSDEQKLDNQLKFVPQEGDENIIKFTFKRRFKRPILKKMRNDDYLDIDPIPEEEYPGQWKEIWDNYSQFGFVSYPPEDEFIEQYLQYLRKRIKDVLKEEQASSMEFRGSLEDGIDWRKTMRHYHEDKIYVKKYPHQVDDVGAIIIQFKEEPLDPKYNYHSTLFAEHDQESHISIITTEPGDVIIGPGITRIKYAALISQFPPDGMPALIPKDNVDLKIRLIHTAMEMALTRVIGFVAKRPPTPAQRKYASEEGYRLIYLPMEKITQKSLQKLRTMHLLAHPDLRDQAREYIGF